MRRTVLAPALFPRFMRSSPQSPDIVSVSSRGPARDATGQNLFRRNRDQMLLRLAVAGQGGWWTGLWDHRFRADAPHMADSNLRSPD